MGDTNLAAVVKAGRVSTADFVALVASEGGDQAAEGAVLVRLALHARDHIEHVVPISAFNVGAALLTGDGSVFLGVNTELADVCVSMHAEQSAIHHALSSGARPPFSAIGISASPCGLCRQLLSEAPDAPSMLVHVHDTDPVKLGQLLPDAFSPSVVGKHALGEGKAFTLTREAPTTGGPAQAVQDGCVQAAATLSQSCWTESPAAVSLCFPPSAPEAGDGRVVTGVFLESVAHNPSVNAAVGALNKSLLQGKSRKDWASVTCAAAAYVGGSGTTHAQWITRRSLQGIPTHTHTHTHSATQQGEHPAEDRGQCTAVPRMRDLH